LKRRYNKFLKSSKSFLTLLSIFQIIWIVVVLTGCSTDYGARKDRIWAGLSPEQRAANRAQAQKLLQIIRQSNATLTSFKGIGRFSLRRDGLPPQRERIAWIGAPPRRLKVVVLAFGRPTLTVATDGSYLYLVDFANAKHPYRKLRTKDANLKDILSIPIRTSEILAMLTGRIPIPEHTDLGIIPHETANRQVLVLTRKWHHSAAKIMVDKVTHEVKTVERFSHDGSLIYRARFVQMQTVNGYRVPAKLVLSTEDGVLLQLDIEQYMADVDITPTMFALTPPNE
jgi:hypothetical protein